MDHFPYLDTHAYYIQNSKLTIQHIQYSVAQVRVLLDIRQEAAVAKDNDQQQHNQDYSP